MNRLISHPWKGNVRELENVVRRCVLLTQGQEIRLEDIDWVVGADQEGLVSDEIMGHPYKEAKMRVLEKFHRNYLSALLARHHGNVTRAAKDCGLERQSLQQVMRRYGIKARDIQPMEE